jgi:RNA polymerase sigma-70 factor (ECF subfamily)
MRDEHARQTEALRRAVLAGDQDAWRMLYDGAYAPLWAYVVWRSAGLRHVAEDVTQETWLIAVRRLRDFDPRRGDFLAWLRGIAAKVLQNRLRLRPMQALEGTEAAEPSRDTEVAEQIARALAQLPAHYEAVLRAKYLEELPVGEIAAAWNATPKTIESLLTRARQAFRQAYERLDACDVPMKEPKP